MFAKKWSLRISIVSDTLPLGGVLGGKHFNYTLIRRTVTGFKLFEIIFESRKKNQNKNCSWYKTSVTFVYALSQHKKYFVKFKHIITSGLQLKTISETLPFTGFISNKSLYHIFPLRNIFRLSPFIMLLHL